MPRRTDAGETARRVERRILERVLSFYAEWRAAHETHGVEVISYMGREFHILDVLDGIEDLPPRQRQALTLTCLLGYTQDEAARLMGLTGRSSPVQQYKDAALDKMLARRARAERHYGKATPL